MTSDTPTLRIAIADDEAPARDWLKSVCARLRDTIPNTCVAEYPHGTALLKGLSASTETPFDVLLLDINMPGLNGIEIAAYFKSLAIANPSAASPSIIFVTAQANHALEAFDLNAVDYILKPVSAARLAAALAKAVQKLAARAVPQENPSIQVQSKDGIASVKFKDVLFFHADTKLTRLKTANGHYHTLTPLGDFESLAQSLGLHFHRCHRAYLLNLQALSVHNRALLKASYLPAIDIGNKTTLDAADTSNLVLISRRAWSALNKAVKGL